MYHALPSTLELGCKGNVNMNFHLSLYMPPTTKSLEKGHYFMVIHELLGPHMSAVVTFGCHTLFVGMNQSCLPLRMGWWC